MTNQKNAIIMPADKQFKVLQTQEGNALFFSINDANQFFCTREIQGDVNGWGQIDLMQGIAGTPKIFDIAQDLTTNSVSIIAVITDSNNKDHLYVSVGNKNTDADWTSTPPSLAEISFDDPDTTHNYDGLPISDIYLAEASNGQYIIADIVTGAFVSRYFVDPSGGISEFGNKWIPHDLSGDLNPGTIINALGFRPKEDIPGIYTFGAIGNETELIYTPLYNEVQAGSAISSTVFTMPSGITEVGKPLMVVSAANAPYTDLFLAYGGSLYFLANADQQNLGKAPACIYTHDLLKNMSSLHVNNWNGNVVVWGLSTDDNNETQVFIMECPSGSEAVGASDGVNGTAWSCPIPLIFGAVNVASFVNNRLSSSVIFAHMDDGTLLQLIEDPITTAWRERSILIPPPLPPAVLDQPYESITYTTHLEFLDDYKSKIPNTPVTITASSPISVYIDDIFYNLDTTVPVNITTDQTGTLNIMQPVDNLGCVCYNISAGGESITINPMTDMMGPDSTIAKVSKGDDLNVTVTDETGAQSSLLGDNVQSGDRDAAAATIIQLTKAAVTMPTDGSLKNLPVSSANPINANLSASKNPLNRPKGKVYHDKSKHTIFGVDFTGGRVKYLEGIDQMTHFGVSLDKDSSLMFHAKAKPGELGLGGFKSWIESKAGKVLRWVKKVVNTVENWVINLGTDVADFFVTIAGEVYHFVLNCYHDVVNGLHSLLNTLETTFEKIKQWVGFLFSFQDILRTHNVMKTMINVYVQYTANNFASLKDDITEGFNQLKQQIDQKTGLPVEGLPDDITYSSDQAIQGGTPPKDSDSPAANYGHHHLKSNGNSSGITYKSEDNGPDDSIFTELLGLINAEGDAFKTAGSQIQDIAKNIKSQPVSKTITQFMGVVVDLLVNTAENILLAAVNVIQQLIVKAQDVMNAIIPIPVLSYFYKKITKSDEFPNGQDLTPLDVCCLIGAIPATVIYKAVKGSTPFPEGAQTDAIINATDIQSLQVAMVPFTTASVGSVAKGLLGHGTDNGETLLDIISSICATFGAIAIDLSVFRRAQIPYVPIGPANPADVTKGRVWSGIAVAAYMLYVIPDAIEAIQGVGKTLSNTWYVNLNNACTTAGVGKAIVDATAIAWGGDTYGMFVSPILDFVINALWQVPTTEIFLVQRSRNPPQDDVNNVVSLAGGTAFDASGILSPVYAGFYYQAPSEVREIGLWATVAVISLCNLGWGGCCLATTFDKLPVPSLPNNN